jgi:hypothetical protein
MQNWYYRLWADAIVSQRRKKAENTNWKLYTLIPISIIMGINLFTFFYWMKELNRNLPLYVGVSVFNAHPLNSFLSVLATFIVPFVILNYLLIFNNDRYERIVSNHYNQNGKLYRKYVLYSLGILFIPILVQVMFF